MTVLFLLITAALAAEPTTDDVITAAEIGGVEKVRDTVVPGLAVDVLIDDPADIAFQLLAHTCTTQESAELEKKCAATVAEYLKAFTGAYTSDPADIEAAPPRRRQKGGFVVYLEDPDTGKIIFH